MNLQFQRRKLGDLIHEHAGARRAAGELIRHLVQSDPVHDPEMLRDWKSSAGHQFLRLEEVDQDTTALIFAR